MKSFVVLLSLLCVPVFAVGGDVDTRFMAGLGDAHYRYVESRIVGRAFHVYVSLPPDYADRQEDYPAIYLLDGGGLFPLLAAYHRYLRLGEEVEPAIIVGIGYGGEGPASNFRGTDYTAPSPERESWGGAARFQAFLAGERPWTPKVREFPGHSHMSLPPAAFRDGLRWLASAD